MKFTKSIEFSRKLCKRGLHFASNNVNLSKLKLIYILKAEINFGVQVFMKP